MKPLLIFSALFFILFSNALSAQTTTTDTTVASTQLYVITKHDGTEYIGTILSDDGREVLIETEALGKIYIPKSEIKSMKKIEDKSAIVGGEYQAAGPFTTRYCFTTNALPIKKGEDYALVNLYGPEVHFALSDRFSLGVMTTWIGSPMIAAAKYSIPTKNEKLNFSVGTLMGSSGYLNNFRGFGGLHFANVTFGTRKTNMTFAAGYAYIQAGGSQFMYEEGTYYGEYSYETIPNHTGLLPLTKGPIFSIAGIIKVGAKASFVFDSMIGVFSGVSNNVETTQISPPDYTTNPYTPAVNKFVVTNERRLTTALFIMPGMRFQSTDRKAFQVSIAGVSMFRESRNTSFPLPMCTWFYKF